MTGRRKLAGLVTSVAVAAGLLMGGPAAGSIVPGAATVTVDKPRPNPQTDRPNPRCAAYQARLIDAKADVKKAKQRLKAAPKNKKPAKRKKLKAAKHSRDGWQERVDRFC